MTLCDDVIEQFGRSIGIEGLQLRENGALVLDMGRLGRLAFELVGERRATADVQHDVAEQQVETGILGLNEGALASEAAPFGGVKESGLGREGSHHGIDDYVEIKYLCVGDILK